MHHSLTALAVFPLIGRSGRCVDCRTLVLKASSRGASWETKCLLRLPASANLPETAANKHILYTHFPVAVVSVDIRYIHCILLSPCQRKQSAECQAPLPEQTKGGDQGAEDERKGNGNAVAVDRLPPPRLPVHHPHLHHPHRPLRVRHRHPAVVRAAPAVVTLGVSPESSLKKGKRRRTKRKGRKRSGINVKKTRKQKEERKTRDLYRSPST